MTTRAAELVEGDIEELLGLITAGFMNDADCVASTIESRLTVQKSSERSQKE